ncbi:putative galactose oxidase, beta-propeller [Rosa chinensis]|uniref:Putative galactose oxidase, beta-propeller n=1 Tax=Rosa chinensis TaxID=74649 RepID=A0A2P6PZ00_ROSCH|nr:putative galactose oxidase, beta-propeller [Rosa chinensis]
MLPNGEVLIINCGTAGIAGWEIGSEPVLNPVLYRLDIVIGSRFEVQNPSTVPQMYHSTTLLLRHGRVLIGSSNPHKYYRFINVLYPIDLSLEAFHPSSFF